VIQFSREAREVTDGERVEDLEEGPAGLQQDGFQLAAAVDGAGVGFRDEALDQVGAFGGADDFADLRVRSMRCEHETSTTSARGDEPAALREEFSDLGEVMERDAVEFRHFTGADAAPWSNGEVGEHAESVVGMVVELHGEEESRGIGKELPREARKIGIESTYYCNAQGIHCCHRQIHRPHS